MQYDNESTITDCNFTRNAVNNSGGAIFMDTFNATIANSSFQRNFAPIGGAMRYVNYIPKYILPANNESATMDSCGSYYNNSCEEN